VNALKTRISHIPKGNPNRPALPMNPKWITVHETGNPKPGMGAEAHRRFTHNGGGAEQVSFHWTVDDHEAIQLLPHEENAWHAGDGYTGVGNRSSIAIEACVNVDGDWQMTVANLAELIARIMHQENIPLDRVVQHNRWSGKACPTNLRRAGWAALLADVERRHAARLAAVAPVPPPPADPHAADKALLERAWWLDRLRLGEQVGAGLLTRPWGDGVNRPKVVLICRRGVLLAAGGRAHDVTDQVRDDLTGYLVGDGSLVRWG
jgi:hypothetical protein